MTISDRDKLIHTILKNESLRPITRLERLLRAPLRTVPYYLLATAGHLHPFPITFTTLWKTKMTCYLPEGNTFFFYGYCEANLTNFFIRYVREGMIIIDVGAHVGIYSMLGSELVGTSGSVHSFEPTPRTFTLLKKNTSGLTNVTPHNEAVAAAPGTLTFADYGAGYGAYNSASKSGAPDTNRPPQNITVPSITLDQYCIENNLTPSLIKIDAEGFEYEVLSGSTSLLSASGENRPLITIEVAGGDTWSDNRKQSFALLAKHHYLPYEIHKDGTLSPHTLHDTYVYDNLLFIPQERIAELTSLMT